MAPHSSTLAWKIPWTEEPGRLQSMGSLRVRHDWATDFTFTFHFHALEKEMATHSNVLAWRIPGIEEPGGLPSMGLHRVGHDWRDLAAAAAAATSMLWVAACGSLASRCTMNSYEFWYTKSSANNFSPIFNCKLFFTSCIFDWTGTPKPHHHIIILVACFSCIVSTYHHIRLHWGIYHPLFTEVILLLRQGKRNSTFTLEKHLVILTWEGSGFQWMKLFQLLTTISIPFLEFWKKSLTLLKNFHLYFYL